MARFSLASLPLKTLSYVPFAFLPRQIFLLPQVLEGRKKAL
jgi:hypothetical protein